MPDLDFTRSGSFLLERAQALAKPLVLPHHGAHLAEHVVKLRV